MFMVVAGHPCHISLGGCTLWHHSHPQAAASPQSGSDLGYHLSPFTPESLSDYSLELWTKGPIRKKKFFFLFFRKITFRIIILNVTPFYNFYYEIYHEGQRVYIVNTCSLKIKQ